MAALVLDCWEILVGVFVCLVVFLKWNQIRYSARKSLPPGTMGWSLFGETPEFMKYGPDFMKRKATRYGSLFKTHVLGCPTIICMDPELNRYILMNEGKGLVPGYPQSMLDIMGTSNIAAVPTSAHKHIRGSLLSLINPSMIKDFLLLKTDKAIRSFLDNWEGKTIDIQDETKEMAFLVAFWHVFGTKESVIDYKSFKQEFDAVAKGALSLPINIPGSDYYNGLQGRKRVIRMLQQAAKVRRASGIDHDDMFDKLLKNEDPRYYLNDEEIYDQVMTIFYSGYETVSVTTMMAIKYLHDHPQALQEIRKEHSEIRAGKNPEDPITWNDYKSMKFTRAVIFEASRLATVVNGVLRKTTKDVELKGFIIPKGWRIYVYTREINYDPSLYPEPLTFNPWRWLENNMESHSYCFLFGGGTRLCPGKELGIYKVSIFLHYFLTKYRWEEVGGEKLEKFPRIEAPNGLHIRVSKNAYNNI